MLVENKHVYQKGTISLKVACNSNHSSTLYTQMQAFMGIMGALDLP